MSSVAAAHELTRDLGDLLAPGERAKVKLEKLYRELTKRLPTLTRRRVRALFFAEVSRVDYEEMRALEELRAEEELRRARRQFATSANILAAHYAQAGETLARDEMLEISRRHGAMGLSGTGGDAR